ncbi:Zn peptidase [Faecalibacterium prausnitzii]|uniref:Zn peptidase n=1 Tax=Faecalibacterium prausnitzii TaxID=853 RepID=A0A329UFL1_9FIRM|nr:Zn peptidase [Faecalibacterium prausnitzii]
MARYLSRADLSRIAGKYIDQYYTCFGISKDNPSPINLEQFASSVLGLNVKMLPLCSDGSILGLTVFQKCRFTVILGDGTKLVEVFMPRDVVIDSALAADRCTGCRNFTIAHEVAHQILADLFPNDYGKAVKCRGHIAYRERNGQPSWEEWQANTLAAELLMPTFLVNAEIERAALRLPNGILYKSASDPNYNKILEMAARMGVSWSAIRIRLQQMQVINGKPIHCHPLDIIRFGE